MNNIAVNHHLASILCLLLCVACRQVSAFKPLNPNILNIRAKVPSSHNHHSHHHHHTPTRSLSDVGSSSSSSPPIPPHIKTSSAAPPLFPRVARMSASSVSSSSVTGRNSPHSAQACTKSISNTHVPVTITGGRSSRSSELSRSSSSAIDAHHVHIGGGATAHVSKHSSSSSPSSSKLNPGSSDSHRRASSPHSGLMSVHHSMSTSSNITPPNVVMGPSESSSSPLAVIAKDKDKVHASIVSSGMPSQGLYTVCKDRKGYRILDFYKVHASVVSSGMLSQGLFTVWKVRKRKRIFGLCHKVHASIVSSGMLSQGRYTVWKVRRRYIIF